VWRAWAGDVTGAPIESGHHLAEEAPGPLAEQIATLVPSKAGAPVNPGQS
jgi:haloacetate dehalogenase